MSVLGYREQFAHGALFVCLEAVSCASSSKGYCIAVISHTPLKCQYGWNKLLVQ